MYIGYVRGKANRIPCSSMICRAPGEELREALVLGHDISNKKYGTLWIATEFHGKLEEEWLPKSNEGMTGSGLGVIDCRQGRPGLAFVFAFSDDEITLDVVWLIRFWSFCIPYA
jgi:hypothetical protein